MSSTFYLWGFFSFHCIMHVYVREREGETERERQVAGERGGEREREKL